jgi:hypothetical protein
VLHSKGQKAKPGQSGQRSTDKVRKKNKKIPPGAWMFVCCVVVSEAKMQESKDKEISTDEVQTEYKKIQKNHAVSMDFLTAVCG